MARILFTHSTFTVNKIEVLPPFYEGFLNVLRDSGNQVLHIATNKFIKKAWNGTNALKDNINRDKLTQSIKDFDPELVIAFNNSTINDIDKIVDCPIVLWNADTEHYYNDREKIKANVGRYHFACVTEQIALNPKQLFGACDKQVFIAPFSTQLCAQDLQQSKNISFIGSVFKNSPLSLAAAKSLAYIPAVRAAALEFFQRYESDPSLDVEGFFKTCKPHLDERDHENILAGLLNICSVSRRINTLKGVADLGLELFGGCEKTNWRAYSDEMLLSLLGNPSPCYSIQHNQDLYNASKICVSISHAQASGAYPWRVVDIMATNGCLVTDYSSAIAKEFSAAGIPMYRTVAEARSLCEELLRDDAQRRQIVLESQKIIETNYRFEHRLMHLENIFGLKMLSQDLGLISQLHAKDFRQFNLMNAVKRRAKSLVKSILR